jgi:hypothetical protein
MNPKAARGDHDIAESCRGSATLGGVLGALKMMDEEQHVKSSITIPIDSDLLRKV